jgi:hypothetical protein
LYQSWYKSVVAFLYYRLYKIGVFGVIFPQGVDQLTPSLNLAEGSTQPLLPPTLVRIESGVLDLSCGNQFWPDGRTDRPNDNIKYRFRYLITHLYLHKNLFTQNPIPNFDFCRMFLNGTLTYNFKKWHTAKFSTKIHSPCITILYK